MTSIFTASRLASPVPSRLQLTPRYLINPEGMKVGDLLTLGKKTYQVIRIFAAADKHLILELAEGQTRYALMVFSDGTCGTPVKEH